MPRTTRQLVDDFDAGIEQLNAQLWTLLAACEHGSAVARDASPLDGHPYEKSLHILLSHAPSYRARIRLRSQRMSSDLNDLYNGAERWLPAYFLVLCKALGEGALGGLVAVGVTRTPARTRFEAFRRARRLTIARGVDFIAAAAARGDWPPLEAVFDVTPVRRQLAALAPKLRAYNRIRNSLAHDLGRQIQAGVPVTVGALLEYFDGMGRTVRGVAQIT